MDETEELIGLMGRAAVVQMGHAPGFELSMIPGCVLALTGEPLIDFNSLTLGPNPDAEGFLQRSVARVKARGLPMIAVLSPHVAARLAPAARRLGLRPVGAVPLMVLRGTSPVGPVRRIDVVRVLGPDLVRTAGDLVAAAFDAPREAVARGIDAGITESAGVEWYVARDAGAPVGVVCITPAGTTAGIWSMGTPPRHQHKGFGRALLTHVIDDYRRRGVERFFLTATAAGFPLYASLGFQTVAELSAWILES